MNEVEKYLEDLKTDAIAEERKARIKAEEARKKAQEARIKAEEARKKEQEARIKAESRLAIAIRGMLKSGMSTLEVAEFMEIDVAEIESMF